MKRNGTCSFPECGKLIWATGLCSGHLNQFYKGHALKPLGKRRPNGSPPVIEYREVDCLVAGLIGMCHEFSGGKKNNGYGQVRANGRMIGVHRYVWEQVHGTIPEGLVVDHQCRNRACINLDHLRVVTQQQNVTENVVNEPWQIFKAKTHCIRGHPFDEANTCIRKNGGRECKACKKLHQDKRRKKEIT